MGLTRKENKLFFAGEEVCCYGVDHGKYTLRTLNFDVEIFFDGGEWRINIFDYRQ